MEGTSVDTASVQQSLPGTSSASRRVRRRAVTLSLTLDDAGLERALLSLTALARAADPRAVVVASDPAHELPWTELSFLAVDVETTGFIAGRDRVIEIAWVRFERGREVERFSSLLRVDVEIPPVVRRLTGIIPSMLAGKPVFADVAGGLLEALASVDFAVAYNARFDRGFLAAELTRCDRALTEVPWVDPLAFVRGLEANGSVGGKGGMSKGLVDVAHRFGVALPSAHRAENDARATGELLLRLAPRIGAKALTDLVDKQERWTRLEPPPVAPEHRLDDVTAAPTEPPGIGARLLALFR